MSFDGVFTHAMVHELNQQLENGRVSKIQQPYQNEVVLIIRSQGKNHRLLLSAHPSYARIQLTTIPYENPAAPPNFCMMMRKQLEGAVLEDIQQIGNDRIVHFTFRNRNEIGDVQSVVLIVELMGRHSNIFLVDQETKRIMDTIRHVPQSQNTYRSIMPGGTYLNPPHQDKLNPFETTQQHVMEILETPSDLTDEKKLQHTYQGIGSDTAKEILFRSDHTQEKIPLVFESFFHSIDTGSITPTLVKGKKKEFFTPATYLSLEGTQEVFPTLSELLDAYYENKADKDRVHQQASDLIHLVQTEIQRNSKKLKKLKKELNETEKADEYRIKGEVLTAYLHELQKGQEKVTLGNFYENNEPLTIQLDLQKTPSQNAQRYFSKYQKLKTAVGHITEQIQLTKEELVYLDSVSTQLELATPKDVADIKEELIQQGYIKKKRTKTKQKQQKMNQPEKFKSSDGTSILLGKNNLQNDQLTMKTARKSDIWLHAKDIPGSHVIIQNSDPSEQTLLEAANIAAYYSKSQLSASVPVDYVEVKKIRKPNGAKPGYVIYEGQKTLYVTPDKKTVDQLKV